MLSTDYGHRSAKFNSQWLINNKQAQGIHSTKMGADKSAENNPECPKIYLPKFSAQAQKFGISMKKGLLGVLSHDKGDTRNELRWLWSDIF